MNKFIPIHAYAKLKGVSQQNVYRWIRERKFKEEDISKETITATRMRINENAKIKKIND